MFDDKNKDESVSKKHNQIQLPRSATNEHSSVIHERASLDEPTSPEIDIQFSAVNSLICQYFNLVDTFKKTKLILLKPKLFYFDF